jgi:hypothetical protein
VRGSLARRLFLASVAIGLIVVCFNLGFWLADPTIPWEVMLVFVAAAYVGTAIYTFPLLVWRSYSKRPMGNIYSTGKQSDSDDFQFSVKQLLILTSLLAILFGVARIVIPNVNPTTSNPPWHEIVPFCLFYLLGCGSLVWVTFTLVFETRFKWLSLIGLVGASLGALPILSVFIMGVIFSNQGMPPGSRVFGSAAIFFLSHSLALLLGFVVCRSNGFVLMDGQTD